MDGYSEWKWSNGEKMEKSTKETKVKVLDDNTLELALQEGLEFSANKETSNNKREMSNSKLMERGMTAQTNMNPFLNGDYIEDLNVQENFLKPKNSNYAKE